MAGAVRTGLVVGLLGVAAIGVAGAQPLEQDAVWARVNGVPITAAAVDDELGGSLAKLQEQIYSLRRARLDALIEQQLLEREAAKRGLTTAALTEAEIASRVQPATDADAAEFFEANKSRIQGDLAAVRDQIKTYLTSQRLAARRQEFVAALRKEAVIDVLLTPPAPFRAEVPTGGAPARGGAAAPVTIVEFSDYHCPYCRRAQPILEQLLARYGEKIRLVFKDMPLDNLHPRARAAAEAAHCAGEQGKYWEYHDKLFAGDADVTAATLNRLAGEVGAEVGAFEACRASGRYTPRIEASVQDGRRLGVTGTPTFFINGRELAGAQPVENFARIIDEELKLANPAASAQRR